MSDGESDSNMVAGERNPNEVTGIRSMEAQKTSANQTLEIDVMSLYMDQIKSSTPGRGNMQAITFDKALEWRVNSIIVPNHHSKDAFQSYQKKQPYIDTFVHAVGGGHHVNGVKRVFSMLA